MRRVRVHIRVLLRLWKRLPPLEKLKVSGQYLGIVLTCLGLVLGAMKYRQSPAGTMRASVVPLPPPEDVPLDARIRERYAKLGADETTMRRLRPLMASPPHYPEARKLLERLRARAKSRAQVYAVDEYIASTYFYANESRAGLDFLARVTRDLPRDDFRYRWQYHQFIRKIAATEGREKAEQVIDLHRRQTQRIELSRVWIAVPLQMMETLRDGGTADDPESSLENADREYLRELVDERPDEPFLDHAYYVLGEYDEVVSRYPQSYIRDTALRAAIYLAVDCSAELKTCDVHRARQLLAQLGEQFPDQVDKATVEAGEILAAAGRLAEAEAFVCHDGCTEGDRFTMLNAALEGGQTGFGEILDWLAPRDPQLLADDLDETFAKSDDSFRLAGRRDYAGAYDTLSAYRARLRELKMNVPKALSQKMRDFKPLAGRKRPRTAEEYFQFGLAEVRAARRTPSSDIGRLLRENAAETFHMVETVGATTPWAPKACYLRAAALRRNHESERANEVVEHFLQTHRGSPLYDDMMTEKGWYLLNVRRDPLAAQKVFDDVARLFPEANAADNALTLLADSQWELCRFDDALRTYNRIARSYPGSRLGTSAVESARSLAPIVRTRRVKPGIDGLRFTHLYDRPIVGELTPGTYAERSGFLKDDLIVAVGDTNIGSLAAFHKTIAAQQPGTRIPIRVRTPDDMTRVLMVTIGNVDAYDSRDLTSSCTD